MISTSKDLSLEDSNVVKDFDMIRMGIASPDTIRSWSYGEVLKPETINYRTFKPEKRGLFCCSIFGPIKDYECLCGKYRRMKYKGIVCDVCGVEVTSSSVRRQRMGHIELCSPVVHTWFLRSSPSRIGALLDMTLSGIEKIIYFESSVVVESNEQDIKVGTLMNDDQIHEAYDKYGEDSFRTLIGGEAIEYLLKNLDLVELKRELQESLASCSSAIKRKKLAKRLRIVINFLESDNQPEWMVIKALPVSPPDIRPLVMLDSGRFAISDHNDLYRRILNRNNRLKKLISLMAPEVIIRNEKRMLQEVIDSLFDSSKGRKSDRAIKDSRTQLKSIVDMLKGKQGRFRQNLLGKRVDYSGRSVITVGPNLKLHQCGLPKKMALELFKPFLYAKLLSYGIASTMKAAKKMVDLEKDEIWDILEEIIDGHPILLNRAPTLHRLSIQAFEPFLVEDQAIVLHPLVCSAFNADFDGDQMSVHVPLSLEAQTESRVLMMSTNNVLSLSNGQPVIVPTADIVLGVHYLTLLLNGQKGENKIFDSWHDVEFALEADIIKLYTKILYRLPDEIDSGEEGKKIVETTPGRVKLLQILPINKKIPFSMINKVMKKTDIAALINAIYKYCGSKLSVVFVDKIMKLGFDYSFYSGISFGMDDMIIPETKQQHINETVEHIKAFEEEYQHGLITEGERYNKVIDAWSQCTDRVTQDLVKLLSKDSDNIDEMNNIHLMSASEARGAIVQVKQIVGMRGLMVKPSGQIIETPIKSNFKEGLTIFEYFSSTHGARKGLADTALKTANAGYFTRRLVDVALDCAITEQDCGTEKSIMVANNAEEVDFVVPFAEKIFGRVAAEDIFDNKHGMHNKIISNGELITPEIVEKLVEINVPSIKIRSILTCEAKEGLCSKCYGIDLSIGKLAVMGEAVGVIAAQSIGEPGTQLTLNTFHVGGAASASADFSSISNNVAGKVFYDAKGTSVNSNGDVVVVVKSFQLSIHDTSGKELEKHDVPYGAHLLVKDGQKVPKNSALSTWDPYSVPVLSSIDGNVKFVDIIENVTINHITDEDTGISQSIVQDFSHVISAKNLNPAILIESNDNEATKSVEFNLNVNALITVEEGDKVKKGDVLVKMSRGSVKTKDIIGGLQRVIDIFEARRPKSPAILAEFDGTIEIRKDYKSKRKVTLISSDESDKKVDFTIPKTSTILVSDGEKISKGDIIVDGVLDLHDILRINGVEALSNHMIAAVQSVYRLQGVKIDNKHLEIIIRHMLQKVEIVDPGDTVLSVSDRISIKELNHVNDRAIADKMNPAKGVVVLSGITKSASQNSFISSAAFQETAKVLTDAAVCSKVDELKSLKENLITGRLIPVGTGLYVRNLQQEALSEKNLII